MRKIGEIFNLSISRDTWLRVAAGHPDMKCRSLEDPTQVCIFRRMNCACDVDYKMDTGACKRYGCDVPEVIFLRTIAPLKVVELGTRKCIKAPNSVTTIGKEYILERLVDSENFRFVDDTGEYTYIMKEDIGEFFVRL